MSRIVVVNNLSLDGVMQAPGRPDEDTRDGFAHGGWAVPYQDEVIARAMGERMAHPGALILGSGRRMFADDSDRAALRLVDSMSTTTGVVIATYQPAD